MLLFPRMGDGVHECAGRIATLAGLGGGEVYFVLLHLEPRFQRKKHSESLDIPRGRLANAIAAND